MLLALQMATDKRNTARQLTAAPQASLTVAGTANKPTEILPAGRTRMWQSPSTACSAWVPLLLQAPIILPRCHDTTYCLIPVSFTFLCCFVFNGLRPSLGVVMEHAKNVFASEVSTKRSLVCKIWNVLLTQRACDVLLIAEEVSGYNTRHHMT